MSHEIETAMYVGKPAWHKLGTLLANPPTVEEAIRAAGLDWTVALERLFLADLTRIDDRFAVRRESDRKVLGTVGKGFRTVQNKAAFAWFQSFLDAGLVTLEAAGSLRGGARVWVLAKIKGDDAVIVPQADDRVAKYLLLAHGHDGSLAIHLGVTPTRVVCNNTLSAAIGERASLRIRHTKGAAGAMDAAKEVIARANGNFDKAAEVYRALAGTYVRSGRQIRDYIDAVFPPPPVKAKPAAAPVEAGHHDLSSLLSARPVAPRDSVFSADNGATTEETRQRIYGEIEALFQRGRGNDLPGVKGTAWAAYNAVTEYITHERGRSDDNRVNTAWFGPEGPRAIQAAAATFLSAPAASLSS
jgi:phage/plasmid-like protein (TIGR03299 family)